MNDYSRYSNPQQEALEIKFRQFEKALRKAVDALQFYSNGLKIELGNKMEEKTFCNNDNGIKAQEALLYIKEITGKNAI